MIAANVPAGVDCSIFSAAAMHIPMRFKMGVFLNLFGCKLRIHLHFFSSFI